MPRFDVVHEDFAVNLGRVHCGAAFEQQVGLSRSPFQQQVELASDQRFLLRAADLLLNRHERFAAALDLARRDFVVKAEGPVFVRLHVPSMWVTGEMPPAVSGGWKKVAEALATE